MSDGNAEIEQKGSLILKKDRSKDRNQDLEGPYLFISFDLVNSTAYKSQSSDWPDIFSSFMESCTNNLRESISDTNLDIIEWKRQGDEILFYIPHPDFDNITKIPSEIFGALEKIIGGLKSLSSKSIVTLSAKATLWAADVQLIKKSSESSLFNIVLPSAEPIQKILDFLGPDIDTGFRISKYASPGKLIIDANLAWIFTKHDKIQHNDIVKKMRIVSLEEMKGVWNSRRYPIIWYYNDWANIDDMFYYDEDFNSNIVSEIRNRKGENLKETSFLEKILTEVNMLKYADELEKTLKDFSGSKIVGLTDTPYLRKEAELHLVAICKDKSDRILALRRNGSRNYKPNFWEFGCTYLHHQQDIKNSLVTGYLEKIGCNITVNDNPIPINYFSITDKFHGISIPGYIFTALIENQDEIKINPLKYSEIKWITMDNLNEIEVEQAVDNFHMIANEILKNKE